MSAHFAESTLSFVAPRVTQPARTSNRRNGLLRVVQWLADMPRRRAVINELSALSDHELADIGLSRSDVARVFDTGFTAQRARA